jgi:hypothetical protein
MPDMLRQLMDLMMDRPLTAPGCAIAAVLCVQLMSDRGCVSPAEATVAPAAACSPQGGYT